MKIEMNLSTAARVKALVDLISGEVGWVGTTRLLMESGRFVGVRVEEIFVPKQEVSQTSVNVRPEKLMEEFRGMEEKISSIRYQGHSHGMLSSVEPSITDLECWEEWAVPLMENVKVSAFSIHNRKGLQKGYIYLYCKEVGLTSFPAEIVVAPDPAARHWAEKQKKEKVQQERTELDLSALLKRRLLDVE